MYRIFVPLVCAALATPYAFGQTAAPEAANAASAPSSSVAISPSKLNPIVGALTLEAAVQAALRQSPRLRAAELEVEANDGAVRQAGVLPNPSLSYQQEDTRPETRTATVQLNQLIELGGKRAARVELARRGRDVAVAELQNRRAEVRANTIQAFFDALIAQERVSIAQASLKIAAGGSAAASRRVAAGKVSPTEETRARVAEANVRIELRQAQAEQSGALLTLATAMGSSEPLPLASTVLDGSAKALPPLPGFEAIDQQLAQSPALRRAQMEVERAQANFDLERSRRMPDLTVSLGSKRAQELGRNQPVIGVSINVPIFDRNQGAQLEALRKRDAAQAQAKAEAQRLRTEALQAAEQLRARSDEVELLQKDVLPGAESAYEAASRGFELGKFGFLDVLDAQRTLLQARAQHLSALSQAHRAAAELERLLGSSQY